MRFLECTKIDFTRQQPAPRAQHRHCEEVSRGKPPRAVAMYGSKRTQGPLGRGKENTAANTAALKKVPPSVGRRGAGGKRSRGEMLAALAMAPKTADKAPPPKRTRTPPANTQKVLSVTRAPFSTLPQDGGRGRTSAGLGAGSLHRKNYSSFLQQTARLRAGQKSVGAAAAASRPAAPHSPSHHACSLQQQQQHAQRPRSLGRSFDQLATLASPRLKGALRAERVAAQNRAALAVGVGMSNLGNTCYMNAVLQMLLALPGFCEGLLAAQRRLSAGGARVHGAVGALVEVLNERQASIAGAAPAVVRPSAIKRTIEAGAARFAGAQQQDAHEFLLMVLQRVQDEVFEGYERPRLQREARRFGRPPNTEVELQSTACPVARSLSAFVEHSMTCQGCGAVTTRTELFNHLSVDLPAAKAAPGSPVLMEALLKGFFDGGHDVERTCDQCGQSCQSTVRSRLKRLPRALILHVKRFSVDSFGRPRKRSDPIQLKPFIDLRDHVTLDVAPPPPATPPAQATPPASPPMGAATPPPADGAASTGGFVPPLQLAEDGAPTAGGTGDGGRQQTCCYRLRGVVSHQGVTAAAGHFVADVDAGRGRQEPSRWVRCNDSVVAPLAAEQRRTRMHQAYILTYELC